MITGIKKLLQQADRIIWGPWLIFLLLGTGCYLMLSLRFLPLKNLPAALRRVFLPESWKGTEGKGVSSFSSLTTELAATIGTGNIVGVATAMVLGGPGALFWMLLSGIIGLSTKLVESTLCVRYRVKNQKGEPAGCLRSYNWHVRGTKSCDSSVCWFRHLLNRHLSIRTNHPDSLGLPCS